MPGRKGRCRGGSHSPGPRHLLEQSESELPFATLLTCCHRRIATSATAMNLRSTLSSPMATTAFDHKVMDSFTSKVSDCERAPLQMRQSCYGALPC